MKKVSAPVKKQNEHIIRQVFRDQGQNISFTTNLDVGDGSSITTFKKVNVVLLIGQSSSIEISPSKKDQKKFSDLGLEEKYYLEYSILQYEDFSDYQVSVKELSIEPIEDGKTVYLRTIK